jgi:hypothetical protein
MPEALDDLLHALRAADPAEDKDPLVDAIEVFVADEGSRAVILAHSGELVQPWLAGPAAARCPGHGERSDRPPEAVSQQLVDLLRVATPSATTCSASR